MICRPRNSWSDARLAGLMLVLSWSCASLCAQSPDSQKVAKLVADLGHADFAVRDAAERQLREIGSPARKELEKALTSDDPELRLRAEEILRELRSDDLWSPSTVTYAGADVPVVDVLREIERQTGNPFDWRNCRGLDDKKISVDWRGATYWESLDELCRLAGLGQRIEDSNDYRGMVLNNLSRQNYPAAYAGPVRLRVVETNRQGFGFRGRREWGERGGSTLDVQYLLHWEPKLRLCRYSTRLTVIEAATDDNELLAFRNFGPPPSPMHVTLRNREASYRTSLRQSRFSQATRLTRLRVATSLTAAGDFSALEVPPISGAVARDPAGHSLEFVEVLQRDDGAFDWVFEWSRPTAFDAINTTDLVDESIVPLGEGDRPMPFTLRRVEGDKTSVRYTIHVGAEPPAKVSMRFARLRHSRQFEFQFADVPLNGWEP